MTQTISQKGQGNPLGYEKLSALLKGYAIPSIIAMLVSSLYNIVDQIFIGQGVGISGKCGYERFVSADNHLPGHCPAHRNWKCVPVFSGAGSGTGGEAARTVGTAVSMMVILGILYVAVIETFLTPLLTIFGATKDVVPYAQALPALQRRECRFDSDERSQQPGQGGWKPEIFYDLYAGRSGHQYDFRSHFYLCASSGSGRSRHRHGGRPAVFLSDGALLSEEIPPCKASAASFYPQTPCVRKNCLFLA